MAEKRRKESEQLKQRIESSAHIKKAIPVPPISIAEQKENQLHDGYEEVKDRFVQQIEPIRDKYGVRWVKCERCGKIAADGEFGAYGGANHVNLGVCSDCYKKR